MALCNLAVSNVKGRYTKLSVSHVYFINKGPLNKLVPKKMVNFHQNFDNLIYLDLSNFNKKPYTWSQKKKPCMTSIKIDHMII
jgi:hypothetical protein